MIENEEIAVYEYRRNCPHAFAHFSSPVRVMPFSSLIFLGDLNHEAEIVSWKNMTSIDVWTDSYCNAINGTDGTMFHPFIEKNETLYMFTNDICRSIYAQYEQDVTVKGWSF